MQVQTKTNYTINELVDYWFKKNVWWSRTVIKCLRPEKKDVGVVSLLPRFKKKTHSKTLELLLLEFRFILTPTQQEKQQDEHKTPIPNAVLWEKKYQVQWMRFKV